MMVHLPRRIISKAHWHNSPCTRGSWWSQQWSRQSQLRRVVRPCPPWLPLSRLQPEWHSVYPDGKSHLIHLFSRKKTTLSIPLVQTSCVPTNQRQQMPLLLRPSNWEDYKGATPDYHLNITWDRCWSRPCAWLPPLPGGRWSWARTPRGWWCRAARTGHWSTGYPLSPNCPQSWCS